MLSKRFLLTTGLILLLSLLSITAIGLLLFNQNPTLDLFSAFFQRYASTLCLFRYVILGLMILFWPYFVQWVGSRQRWESEQIQFVTQLRWYFLIFLMVFEVFIVQNTLAQLVHYFWYF